MKTKFYKICCLLFVLLLVLSGCAYKRLYADANVAYNSGDYDDAVNKSAAAIKDKPDYPEAIGLLKNAAPLAHERHLKKALVFEEKGNFDGAVAEYQAIGRLIYAVASVRKDIDLEDVSGRRDAAAQKAAEAHYRLGQSLFHEAEKANNAAKFKQASAEFRAAQRFAAGYRDSGALYEKARQGAVVRVAVLPFRASVFLNYGRMIADLVVANAMKMTPEFLEFVTREHLSEIEGEKEIQHMGVVDSKTAIEMGKVLGVQHIIIGNVLTVAVDTPKQVDTRGSSSCNVAKRKEPERIATVLWTTHEQKSSALVNASFQIIDVKTGRIIVADSIRTDVVDIAKWMEFTGASDCLTWDVRNFSNGKKDVDGAQILISRAIEKTSRDIAGKLVERFR